METRRYGRWDAEKQKYKAHGGIERRFCRDCWKDQEGRANGAHFRPESAQQLFDILDRANGGLVATLAWWGGKPSFRVIDGEIQAAVRGREMDDGTLVFSPKLIEDYTKEQFLEHAETPEDDELNLCILREPGHTIFGDIDGDEDE